MANHASAAEITVLKDSQTRYSIMIEGVIEPGDFEKAYDVLKRSGPFATSVYLFSPGGDVQESIKIAEMVRALKLETIIPSAKGRVNPTLDTIEYFEHCPSYSGPHAPRDATNCICASACTIIWASGIQRNFGLLRVHRPKMNEQFFAGLSPDDAEQAYEKMSATVDAALSGYGFPTDGIIKMNSIPSYRVEKFEPFGMPELVPFFDELLTARCSSTQNKGEFSLLRIKKRENRASADELVRLEELEKTAGTVERCRMTETMKIHWASFSDYFGVDYEALVRSGELYSE